MTAAGRSLKGESVEEEGKHSKPLLLIVDDEREIALMLKEYFEMQGYLATVAFTGVQALEKARRKPDVILLDVGLPDIDGFSVCRRLREAVLCPIMFLTARIEDADAIDGFAAGADDYVTKPFSLEVLGARVKAQLARESRVRKPSALRIDDVLSIDFAAMTVSVDGVPVPLARKEYEICALLAKHPGQVFDRDMIYASVWSQPGDSSVVTEHVRRLRHGMPSLWRRTTCITEIGPFSRGSISTTPDETPSFPRNLWIGGWGAWIQSIRMSKMTSMRSTYQAM